MSKVRSLALTAGALVVLPVAPASAVQTHSLTYQCKYPLIGVKPVTVTYGYNIPDQQPLDQELPPFPVTAEISPLYPAPEGFDGTLAGSIEGAAKVLGTLRTAGGTTVPLISKLAIPRTPLAAQGQPPVDATATGATPVVVLGDAGTNVIVADGFSMNLTARDARGTPIVLPPVTKWVDVTGQTVSSTDSDGDKNTFDVYCTLSPADQSRKVAVFTSGDAPLTEPDTTPPSTPGAENSEAGNTSLTVRWTPSQDEPGGSGIAHYVVLVDGRPFATVGADQTSYEVKDLQPGTAYGTSVVAYDTAGNQSAPLRRTFTTLGSAPATPTPPVVTPDPTPTPQPPITGKTLDLTYQCKYPLMGIRPITVKTTLGVPNTTPAGVATDPIPVSQEISARDLTAGLGAFGGQSRPIGSLSATSDTYFRVKTAAGFDIPADARVAFPAVDVANPAQDPLVLTGKGELPPLTFDVPGVQRFAVDDFAFAITIRDAQGQPFSAPPVTKTIDGKPVSDFDGDLTTMDVYCLLDPANQNTTFAQWEIVDPPATPAPATPTPTGPAPTPTGPAPTPNTPIPTPPSASFAYSLEGSTKLNTLTKGTMPLTGGVKASIVLATGAVTADLTLNDTQGRLVALGFLPVTATVGFVPSGPTTGKLVDDQLTTNSKVRIKVKSVKAFGSIPLAGGNTCQTKQLSDVTLKSAGSFDPTRTGGTLAGTYAISDLNGCGPLNGLISPVTAGGGNTISVKLTPTK